MNKSSASFNPVLTTLFNGYFQDPAGFVGVRLAPIFRTAEPSSTYPVFGKENFLNMPVLKQRAPGTPYQRSGIALSADQYAVKQYGHETPVPDEWRKKYARQIDADRAAINRNASTILYNHELRVKALFTSNAISNATPATKWDAANSDPVADVKAAVAVVELASGIRPNTITIPQAVIDKLALNAKIRAIYPKYDGPISAEMIRAAFELPTLLIAGGKHNTANEGQAMSIDYLWADDVIISVTNPGQDLEAPNAARTFLWDVPGESGGGEAGSYVETYRDDNIKSDIQRSQHSTDEKLCGASLAYRLRDTLT